tara:strand:- start:3736 stop:3981 length:246 start_codon:yes stop_codon:yes gene_type:complete
MSEPEEETHPTLCWEINETEYELAFGYVDNEPTAALFIKDRPEVQALIPQEVLGIAAEQGWLTQELLWEENDKRLLDKRSE